MSTITGIGQDVTVPETTATTTSTGVDPLSKGTPTSYTPNAKKSGSEFGMDKDAFLKILVEQLRHQDPSQPGDSTEYVMQMTQYSILEQLTNISETTQVAHADSVGNTAIGLVGRTVTYVDDDGNEQSGVVTNVRFDGTGPKLTVGDAEGIQLGSIKEVR
jgi:flagellar basal-body rod modification protein FlgD